MKFDDLIVNYLGEFGTYQRLQFFLLCLPTMFTAMHGLSWTFAGANIPHRCRLPEEALTNNSGVGYWLKGRKDALFPRQKECDLELHPAWKAGGGGGCPYEHCQIGGRTVETCPDGYVYNNDEVSYSAINRWEIVCGRSVLKAVVQSMYYIGQMGGSLLFGFLGDRIGRKKVFFIAILIQIISGLGMVVAPHWIVFSLLRMGVGFAHPGIFVIAVVIGMELVGPSKRKMGSVFCGIAFSFGQIILGALAYFIRDYRYLQLAIAAPSLFFLIYWWIIPESARWLVSQKRFQEADAVLKKAARMNKTTIPEQWWEEVEDVVVASVVGEKDGEKDLPIEEKSSAPTTPQKYHTYADLVRTPKLRQRSLAIFFCWPVVSLVYYGVSMNTNFLGGDLYTTFVFGALMEIPAIVVVFIMADRLGRKWLLSSGFSITALCMFSNLLLSPESTHVAIVMAQFLVAKAAITGSYAVIYMFTPELFPTVVRSKAMGLSSMMARVGAIAASYISMWLVDRFGKTAMIIPFATLALMAAIVCLVFLPETKGRHLPETIEEAEGEDLEEGEEGGGVGAGKETEMQPLSDGGGGGGGEKKGEKAETTNNESPHLIIRN